MDVPTTFVARLNLLFEAIVPPGGQEYFSAVVVERLQASGAAMSAPYLSQLRNGVRTWPSAHTIDAIAGFFGVHQNSSPTRATTDGWPTNYVSTLPRVSL
jgi:transcriptional regulator with XRE-family HTH domain